MFTPRFHRGFVPMLPGLSKPAAECSGRVVKAVGGLRWAVLLGTLALGLPRTSYAQALGTMQVTAWVVPASVAWTGVAEAREAARSAVRERSGRPVVRRGRLLQARAEIHTSTRPGLVIVTLHYLRN